MNISLDMLFIVISTIISIVGIIYLITSFNEVKEVDQDMLDNSKKDK